MRSLIMISVVACFVASAGWATPEAADWYREVVIGGDNEHHVLLVITRKQPGYYQLTSKATLRRVRTEDLSTVWERQWMCTSQGTEAGATGWVMNLLEGDQLSLAEQFSTEGFGFAYSEDLPYPLRIVDSALVMDRSGTPSLVLAAEDVSRQVGPVPDGAKVVGVCRTGHTQTHPYFISLLWGSRSFDTDWTEKVLVVPAPLITKAWERLGE